jgi:hypothetical protein
MCVCRGTWPFSSRNTSSFASGGGVLVSAMARTSQHEQNPRTRQKKNKTKGFLHLSFAWRHPCWRCLITSCFPRRRASRWSSKRTLIRSSRVPRLSTPLPRRSPSLLRSLCIWEKLNEK